ncbi:SDR family NAD(P)-dependent oxidoreductase [Actinophytocola sp.]|uniref:SDR family NAD(P)-dependent oxidoreductase n=1 Tax=Actinophytocola sp. TaxID=1872138 RepID=UPI003C761E81
MQRDRPAGLEEIGRGEYWPAHVRNPVRFLDSIHFLEQQGVTAYLEVGPDAVLSPMVLDCLTGDSVPAIVPTLRPNDADSDAVLRALAEAHVHGAPVQWAAMFPPNAKRIDLPTYPFQHERYWHQPEPTATRDRVDGHRAEAAFWTAVEENDLPALTRALGVDDAALAPLTPALAKWRRTVTTQARLADWHYRVHWQPVAVGPTPKLAGSWLLATPAALIADDRVTTLQRALTRCGARATVVPVPDGADRVALNRLLVEAGTDRAELTGVLSLLAIDGRPVPEQPSLTRGLVATLELLRALQDGALAVPVWFATQDAVHTQPDDQAELSVQTQFWGLGHVLRLEQPANWGGLVDLPRVVDDRIARTLCGVLTDGGEDQLCLRQAGVFARRMVRFTAPTSAARPWRPHGTVLVTGGTGALGTRIARWLALRGAEHLMLVSRRGRDADAVAAIEAELADHGVAVTVAACDVSDRDQVAALLASIPERYPLTAVIHTAAVLGDGVLERAHPDQWAAALGAKVGGAVALHDLTARYPLEQFILFSSIVGVLGNPGAAAYAAANAVLDGLADYRRSRGQAALSIAWGPWAGAGLAIGATGLSQLGLVPMDPHTAIGALDAAVDRADPCIVVADIDWPNFRTAFTADVPSPLLQHIPEAQPAPGRAPTTEKPVMDLAAELRRTPEPQQLRLLLNIVRGQAAEVLRHASPEAVRPDRTFTEIGFDSLTAVQIRNRLNRATSLTLPSSVLFDHPTPVALARHLRDEILGSQPAASTAVQPRTSTQDDPIVVVAMACRLPGGVDTPERLWELLSGERDVVGDLPGDRGWDLANIYDSAPEALGKTYSRYGGFLDDAAEFDAGFFGISPREAVAMDPQQRVLLEVSWEAVERAGIDPRSLLASRTGVFVGMVHQEYAAGPQHDHDVEGYLLTGKSDSVCSGRIAYTLGLEGPALTVDTACSASLVAIHLATQSLRRGECDLALAGGVTIMPNPGTFIEFSRQRALAPDGRCKAFAEAADGFGLAEGAGMLVLETLSQARQHGHPVLATVRGSAINQDGASNGLAAPNGPSQQRVIRQALADARLTPGDIDAVEAHGTGTTLGDPIEAQALLDTYGQDRDKERPLWVGSLKSNIGHTQAAAGVAGVIKMVLAMRHGQLPRSLHIDQPTSHVDWTRGQVRLLTEPLDWPANGTPRRAGISAFGVSGTNAHVIIERPPDQPMDDQPADPSLPAPVLLSGRTDSALRDQAARLSRHISDHPDIPVGDLAYSLATTRTHFEHRAAVLTTDRQHLLLALAALNAGTVSADVVTADVVEGDVAFLFPGQGTQWVGMAAALLDSCEAFASRALECDAALRPYLDWSLLDVLRGRPNTPDLSRADIVQPALFAMMVSLAAALRTFGMTAAAVLGHSQGEIAAAVVAGALTLPDAARVIALRSRALVELTGLGGMAELVLPLDQARERLTGLEDRLSVAAVNGAAHVVISGDADALRELLAACERDKVRGRLIPVDYASHSPQVELVRDQILDALRSITPRPAEIPFYSSVTGSLVDTTSLDAEYWYRNLRDTVQFQQATEALLGSGHRLFVEVSPHPVVGKAVLETLDQHGAVAHVGGLLRRGEGDLARLVKSLAGLHAHGARVDWTTVLAPNGARRVQLPSYPFQRQRYWLPPVTGTTPRQAVAHLGLDLAHHPLIEAVIEVPDSDGVLLTARLSLRSHPWLADHAVAGSVLLPGTVFLELALRAAEEVGMDTIEELVQEAPLVLPETGDVDLRVWIGGLDDGGRRAVLIRARPGGSEHAWTVHARGTLTTAPATASSPTPQPSSAVTAIDIDEFYADLAGAGYQYGPAFRLLHNASRGADELIGEARLRPDQRTDAESFVLHPALLDAALQGLHVLGDGRRRLPFAWRGVRVLTAGAALLRVRLSATGRDEVSVTATDSHANTVAVIESLTLRDAPAAGHAAGDVDAGLYEVTWQEIAGPDQRTVSPRRVAVIAAGLPAAPANGSSATWAQRYPDVPALRAAITSGTPSPDLTLVVLAAPPGVSGSVAELAHQALGDALATVQGWLADPVLSGTGLVVATEGAVAVRPDELVANLAYATVWGLLRTAQTEHPDRITLVDLDPDHAYPDLSALLRAYDTGEPQLALRADRVYAPRLAVASATGLLAVPPVSAWRLVSQGSTWDALELTAYPEASRPLRPGEVRLGLRAAGVNFHDVLVALGLPVDEGGLGAEGAGIVLEIGSDVAGLAAGDRVMGLLTNGFAPIVIVDHRLVAPIPQDWTFSQAASVPATFATAWYALRDLADLRDGEAILIHAAAGGVGGAATQLARLWNADVFATASPGKWPHLRSVGLPDNRIASSRTLDFQQQYHDATSGRGVDVVLDCLAGEFVDASLRLLPRGGRFVEMGKTDVRQPAEVAASYPGVRYAAFDLLDAGPERLGQILREVVDMFRRGALALPPMRTWDIRRAPDALRELSKAGHVGKFVLTVPAALDPRGTVLVTGATGTLGRALARHLAGRHGVTRLLLASRRGPDAPGAPELLADLNELGAEATIVSCDVTDRDAVANLVDGIPTAHPLTAVVHIAGVLADAVTTSVTVDDADRVLAPKVDAAMHLHAVTRRHDLAAFVLYSGAAATFGTAGQGAYAAANAFLDTLAQWRRAQGLPGLSLGWGLWADRSAMTGGLGETDLARLAGMGIGALSTQDGLALFDRALSDDRAHLLALRLDVAAVATRSVRAPLFQGLVDHRRRVRPRSAAPSTPMPAEQAGIVTAATQAADLLDLVRSHAAAVLGHRATTAIAPEISFAEIGFDSLTSVELRNHLNRATGLRLPPTVLFDHPTPTAVAQHLHNQLRPDPKITARRLLDQLAAILSTMDDEADRRAVLEQLLMLTGTDDSEPGAGHSVSTMLPDFLAEADDDELFALLDNEL